MPSNTVTVSRSDLNREAIRLWLAHGGLQGVVTHRPISGNSKFVVFTEHGKDVRVEAFPEENLFRVSVRSSVSGDWGDIELGGDEAYLLAEWLGIVREADVLLEGGYTDPDRVLAFRRACNAWRARINRAFYDDRALSRWQYVITNAHIGAHTLEHDEA